ncbi:Na+/H+ antiporter subunit G [Cohaesibacter celericrescens]|uniref:Na+/H+ antiporter subunit G n=2 Tax=Cohaesibacter celericrescens TaxID=2067669 RepID=A0A2N5XR37_9HYPH|nr:monovalent cation/H(+) antiporter subunit G [Cohaesibacter celericrescens]PLW76982.1 Na+/H+ antiporter subunit G [Cohaesibacter celericrescens]
MFEMFSDILVGILLLISATFVLTASIGVMRFPDVYTRMHSASKAGTLGSGVALLALALYSGELSIVTRALAGIVFFLLTAPVSAHLIARVAYLTGTRPWKGTVIDEYGASTKQD